MTSQPHAAAADGDAACSGGGGRVRGSSPYPWPWDGALVGSVSSASDVSASAVALLVVAEAGTPWAATPEHRARITGLAQAVRSAGGRVVGVTTRHPARLGGRSGAVPASSVPASSDPAWAALLDDALVDVAVTAGGWDGFFASDLELVLATGGTTRLLLVGAHLEVSVHSTMRSANDRGLECLLVVDACVPGDPLLVGAAVSSIEMSGGIFGAVGTTAAVLDALGSPLL